jgi:HEAT repeat protein
VTAAFRDAAFGLGGMVALLLVVIIAGRSIGGTMRRRRTALRPQLELQVAGYLAVDEAPLPEPATGRAERRVFLEVCRDALAELRGADRRRLVELLEQRGTIEAAVAELRVRSTRRRRSAAETLALAPSGQTRRALSTGLDDRDRRVRLVCARALAQLGDDERLLATIERDAEAAPGAVADALLELAATCPEAVGRIAAATSSLELRALALAVIGELRLSDQAPLLRSALASADDEIAARAARGLGLIGDVASVPDLEKLLERDGRSWFVRAATAKALGVIGDPHAVRLLEWQLRDESWRLQANAAEALALLGSEGSKALRRALGSRRESVRAHARAALDR